LASYLLLGNAGEAWSSPVEFEEVERSVSERFIQSGGTLEKIEGVEQVDMGRWKKQFTLTLKGKERDVQSRFLILNSPLHHLSSLL
jgi:hypothetical protein